jgi:hypothetical protein
MTEMAKATKTTGKTTELFGPHSIRASGVTQPEKNGVPAAEIK